MSEEPTSAWTERAERLLVPTYRRLPVAFVRGRGARLWDEHGNEYVDLAAGIAVCALGHAHPALAQALCDQAQRLLHVSNLYHIPEQVDLAAALRRWTGLDRFFFCNSGAEANEAALKLIRAWGRPRGRTEVVVATGGFHGRTLGALSATAQPAFQEPFEPLLPGFRAVPFGDLEALRAAVGPRTAAVLMEPIQCEGGGRFPPEGYWPAVRALCDERGALLVLDEVQTGMGRTGYPLAAHRYGVEPDAVTLAKGLGGGVPIGALGIREHLAEVLGPGTHASTFGGNPLASRAALTVVELLERPGTLDRIRELGTKLLARLAEWRELGVANPRGEGLLVFFDVDDPAALMRTALAERVLVVPAKGRAVRLTPPLFLSDHELAEGLDRLQRALVRLRKGSTP